MTPPPDRRLRRAWYCVRARPRTEHLVTARLAALPNVEACCPRIRYRKPTRRGPVWFSEALFPGYVFARFVLRRRMRSVCHTLDVRGLLRFGTAIAILPDAVIADLRRHLGDGDTAVVDTPIAPGEEAHVNTGPFAGLTALVTRVLPARERVRILITFLGRETEAEVPMQALTRPRRPSVLSKDSP
jgi:transcriptional antiterminator RfaH